MMPILSHLALAHEHLTKATVTQVSPTVLKHVNNALASINMAIIEELKICHENLKEKNA